MSSLGQTLLQAREAKGLTQSQVASQTRILVQIIDDIENEDFHRIAAPIYGRGFVRLYAECVGLEPQPLIREFMDIYEGRRAPTVLVRDIPTEDPVPPPPPSEPVPAPEPEMVSEPSPAPIPAESIMEPDVKPERIENPFAPQMPDELPDDTTSPIPPIPSAPIDLEDLETPPSPPQVPPVAETSEQAEPHRPEDPEIPPRVAPFTSTTPAEPLQAEMPPLWDPPATDASTPAAEPPSIVRGLDLFDQAAGFSPVSDTPAAEEPETAIPAPEDPAQAPESPFLPPNYEYNGPSAAERFKSGISSVSHGVLRSVRKIPRSTWRKSLLVLAAVAVLVVIVLGCMKLYQITAPAKDPCGDGACEYNPQAARSNSTKAVPARKTAQTSPTPPQKATAGATALQKAPDPKTPTKIHSTGQKVTPLYID